MPEPTEADQCMKPAETRWAGYNDKMAELFAERDNYPVDSPERDAAAQAILSLWVAEG